MVFTWAFQTSEDLKAFLCYKVEVHLKRATTGCQELFGLARAHMTNDTRVDAKNDSANDCTLRKQAVIWNTQHVFPHTVEYP